jgi:hypothetical protein
MRVVFAPSSLPAFNYLVHPVGLLHRLRYTSHSIGLLGYRMLATSEASDTHAEQPTDTSVMCGRRKYG